MGGSTGGKQSSATTTQLPASQQRNVDTLMRDSLAYYQGGGPRYFQGNTVAGATPEQQAGRTAATGWATGAGQQGINAATRANNYWLDPARLNDYTQNPGYAATRQGIITDATQTLTDQQLPMIRDSAIFNGQYGGTSQQIGEALAVSRTNEGIAQQLGQLDLGMYQTNVGMQSDAMNRSGDMYNLGLAPSSTLESIGSMNREDEQAQIDADIAKWNFEEMAPLLNLQAFQGFTGNAGQYGGTTYGGGTTGTTGGGNAWAQVAGYAMMALAAYYSHSSVKGELEPVKGVLEKLKELGIYRWKYLDGTVHHMGPTAEDFHRIFQVGDGVTINIIDVCGVLLGALKELAEAKNG